VTRALVAIVGLTFALARAPEAVAQAPATVPNDRAAAQDRIRERVVGLLRERVGLSDDQLRRLAPVSRSFETRRQTIFREERATRQALRRELSAESADQARVAAQIDQLFALQRRRLDLAAEEQRELATFMTPVQRARYLALQEHLRRRTEEMRRRRGDGPSRGGGRRGPPGGPALFE
jgi:Spy/CpxP family protein refolding chaperone